MRNAEQTTTAFDVSLMPSARYPTRRGSTPAALKTSSMTMLANFASEAAHTSSAGSRAQSTTLTLSADAESECKV